MALLMKRFFDWLPFGDQTKVAREQIRDFIAIDDLRAKLSERNSVLRELQSNNRVKLDDQNSEVTTATAERTAAHDTYIAERKRKPVDQGQLDLAQTEFSKATNNLKEIQNKLKDLKKTQLEEEAKIKKEIQNLAAEVQEKIKDADKLYKGREDCMASYSEYDKTYGTPKGGEHLGTAEAAVTRVRARQENLMINAQQFMERDEVKSAYPNVSIKETEDGYIEFTVPNGSEKAFFDALAKAHPTMEMDLKDTKTGEIAFHIREGKCYTPEELNTKLAAEGNREHRVQQLPPAVMAPHLSQQPIASGTQSQQQSSQPLPPQQPIVSVAPQPNSNAETTTNARAPLDENPLFDKLCEAQSNLAYFESIPGTERDYNYSTLLSRAEKAYDTAKNTYLESVGKEHLDLNEVEELAEVATNARNAVNEERQKDENYDASHDWSSPKV